MNELTEMVFIIDRSGSMSGLEQDTIGGFNSLIQKQRKEEGKAVVTTILFDDKIEFLHQRTDILKVKPMNEKQYYARGCTALLDAIGIGIQRTIEIQKDLSKHSKPKHVIFVIMTDGYENASVMYSYQEINKLIKKQKEKYHWEFLFLGARIDAIQEASKIGIHSSRAVQFYEDDKGIEASYGAVCQFTSQMRQDCLFDEEDCSWKEDVEKDFARSR